MSIIGRILNRGAPTHRSSKSEMNSLLIRDNNSQNSSHYKYIPVHQRSSSISSHQSFSSEDINPRAFPIIQINSEKEKKESKEDQPIFKKASQGHIKSKSIFGTPESQSMRTRESFSQKFFYIDFKKTLRKEMKINKLNSLNIVTIINKNHSKIESLSKYYFDERFKPLLEKISGIYTPKVYQMKNDLADSGINNEFKLGNLDVQKKIKIFIKNIIHKVSDTSISSLTLEELTENQNDLTLTQNTSLTLQNAVIVNSIIQTIMRSINSNRFILKGDENNQMKGFFIDNLKSRDIFKKLTDTCSSSPSSPVINNRCI